MGVQMSALPFVDPFRFGFWSAFCGFRPPGCLPCFMRNLGALLFLLTYEGFVFGWASLCGSVFGGLVSLGVGWGAFALCSCWDCS